MLIFSSIFSLVILSLKVVFISLALIGLGGFFTSLLNFKFVPSMTLRISYGLFILILFSYYFYFYTKIHLNIVFFLLTLTGFIYLAKEFYEGDFKKESLYFLFFISFVFFISNLIIFHAAYPTLSAIDNFDILYWTEAADSIMQKVDLSHVLVSPTHSMAPSVFGDVSHILFGTQAILAFISFLAEPHKPTIAITALFFSLIGSWITLSMMELVIFWFKVKKNIALFISYLAIFGAFFTEILYGFYAGELISIFIFLNFLLVISHWTTTNLPPKRFLTTVFQLSPLFSIFIVCYQSFFAFFAGILCYVSIFSICKNQLILKKTFINLMIIISAFLLGYLYFIPNVTYIKLIFSFVHGEYGSTHFFITPFNLFSLPVPLLRGHESEHTLRCIVGVCFLTAFMFFLIKKLYDKKIFIDKNKEIYILALIFSSSVLLYILAYLIQGPQYQVWKFFSYIVFPISFIPVAIVSIFIISSYSMVIQRLLLILLIIFLSLTAYMRKKNDYDIPHFFNNLQIVQKQLSQDKKTKYLVFNMENYLANQAAVITFSKQYFLIPFRADNTGYSYYFGDKLPADATIENTKVIMNEKCIHQSAFTQKENDYALAKLISLDTFKRKKPPLYYSFTYRCLYPMPIGLIFQNESGLEANNPIYPWSMDQIVTFQKEAIFKLIVPKKLQENTFTLEYTLIPFSSKNNQPQKMDLFLNDKKYSTFLLDGKKLIRVFIHKDNIINGKTIIKFTLSDLNHSPNIGKVGFINSMKLMINH